MARVVYARRMWLVVAVAVWLVAVVCIVAFMSIGKRADEAIEKMTRDELRRRNERDGAG